MKDLNIKFYTFTNNAWQFDNIFHYYISKPIFNFGFFTTYKLIDNQLLEYLGPSNSYNKMTSISNNISKYHIGKLSTYLLVFIIFMFFSIVKFQGNPIPFDFGGIKIKKLFIHVSESI